MTFIDTWSVNMIKNNCKVQPTIFPFIRFSHLYDDRISNAFVFPLSILFFSFFLFNAVQVYAQKNVDELSSPAPNYTIKSKDNNFYRYTKKQNNAQYIRALAQAIRIKNNRPEAAKKYAQQVFDSAKQNENYIYQIKALVALGRISKVEKKYREAQQYFQYAFTLASQIEDDSLIIDVLLNTAEVQRLLDRYGEAKNSIKQVQNLIGDAGEISVQYDIQKILGNIYRSQSDHESALVHYLQSLAAARKLKTTSFLVLAYKNLAKTYGSLEDYASAIKYYTIILQVYEDKPKTKKKDIVLVLDSLSNDQRKMGDFVSALKNSRKSLSIKRSLKNKIDLDKTLLNLSVIHRKLSSYSYSLKYANELLTYAQDNLDYDNIISANNQIGLIYERLNQSEKAEKFFSDTINIFDSRDHKEKVFNPSYKAAALRGLASTYYKVEEYAQALKHARQALIIYNKQKNLSGLESVNRLSGEIYFKQENLELSLESFKSALGQSIEISSLWSKASNLIHLGEVEEKRANNDLAISYVLQGISTAKKLNAKSLIDDGYGVLKKIALSKGDFETAYSYISLQYDLLKERSSSDINQRIAEIEVLREVDVQEKKIDNLERKAKISSLELDRKDSELEILNNKKTISSLFVNVNKVFFVFSFLLFLLTLCFLLKCSRVCAKNRKIVEQSDKSLVIAHNDLFELLFFRDRSFFLLNNALKELLVNSLDESSKLIECISKPMESYNKELASQGAHSLQNDLNVLDSKLSDVLGIFLAQYKNINANPASLPLKTLCEDILQLMETVEQNERISFINLVANDVFVFTDSNAAQAFLTYLFSNFSPRFGAYDFVSFNSRDIINSPGQVKVELIIEIGINQRGNLSVDTSSGQVITEVKRESDVVQSIPLTNLSLDENICKIFTNKCQVKFDLAQNNQEHIFISIVFPNKS